MEFKDLFFGVIIEDPKGGQYKFISHCFCSNNDDPKIEMVNKDGDKVEHNYSKLINEKWKIVK